MSSFTSSYLVKAIDAISTQNLEEATWSITIPIEAVYRYPMTWESLCEDYCKYNVSSLISTRQAQ